MAKFRENRRISYVMKMSCKVNKIGGGGGWQQYLGCVIHTISCISAKRRSFQAIQKCLACACYKFKCGPCLRFII